MRNGAYRTGILTLSIVTAAFLLIIFTTVRRLSEGGKGESHCFIMKQWDIFICTANSDIVLQLFSEVPLKRA